MLCLAVMRGLCPFFYLLRVVRVVLFLLRGLVRLVFLGPFLKSFFMLLGPIRYIMTMSSIMNQKTKAPCIGRRGNGIFVYSRLAVKVVVFVFWSAVHIRRCFCSFGAEAYERYEPSGILMLIFLFFMGMLEEGRGYDTSLKSMPVSTRSRVSYSRRIV